jgi:hypothetical protein
MPCAQWEDFLLSYEELPVELREGIDAHLGVCEACRQYLDSASLLDTGLSSLFAGVHLDAERTAATVALANDLSVPAVLPKLPQVLDLIGGLSVLTSLSSVVWWASANMESPWSPSSNPNSLVAACGILAVLGAFAIGGRVYADLRS